MDTARLAAIRAREQAASPGPWVWARDYCMADGRHWCLENPGCQERTVNWRTVLLETHETDFGGISLDQAPDLIFIAAARADVPDLLAEVERLRAVLGGLRVPTGYGGAMDSGLCPWLLSAEAHNAYIDAGLNGGHE